MSKWAERKKSLRPQTISVSLQNLVEMKELAEGQSLPLLITPNMPGLDVNEWCKNNRELLEEKLRQHGGILFRGFSVKSQEAFDEYISEHCSQLLQYKEGATPRTKLSDKVYTSTEFPQEHRIALHNELSYVTTWPSKIWFCSLIPAETGGETIIADVRRVYDRIAPEIRDKFAEKGWILERNYGDGFGLSWQEVFHTDSREDVEAYCAAHRMEWEWKDGDRLRTRQVRPAVIRHPQTNEWLWFNHVAFWHESSLDPEVRAMFLRDFGEAGLPYNTYYGDGSRIEDWEAEALRQAYEENTVAFPWEAGDLMVLDNMLVAHGRNPFTGTRKVLVSMGEPCSQNDVQTGGVHDVN